MGIRQYASITLLSAGLLVSTSHATTLEEIVVTAQKREQSLQDVPISIDVFSGEALTAARVNDIIDLQSHSPSLIAPAVSPPGQGASFRIRGFGSPVFTIGIEPSVATFIDGVYRSRSGTALNDLTDVERVEILKGPQGTLFGKNTTAGVVHVISKKPNFDGLSGMGELSYGEYDQFRFRGSVNAVLKEDTLAGRLSGSVGSGGGWLEDSVTGEDYNDLDRHNIRGQLLFTPNSDLDIHLSFDYSEIDENCCASVRIADGPFTNPLPPPFFDLGTLAGINGSGIVTPPDPDALITAIDDENRYNSEDWGVSGEINWQFGDIKVTSITAYRDYNDMSQIDGDFTGADILTISEQLDVEFFSEELRLSGTLDETALGVGMDWVVGLYYANEEIKRTRTFTWLSQVGFFFPPFLAPAPGLGVVDDFEQDADTFAVFGHVTLSLTDRLRLTGGIRYNDENKDGSGAFQQPNPIVLPPVNPTFTAEVDESEITGTASIQFDVTNDITSYFTFSRGYKAGGINLAREAALGATPDPTFDPEFADHYEFGIKSNFLNKRLRINTALFRTEYDDLQLQIFEGVSFFVRNTSGAVTQGVEMDGVFAAADNIELRAGMMWLDADFDSDAGVLSPGGPAVGGTRLPWAPEMTFTMGWASTHAIHKTGWSWFIDANFMHRSEYFTESDSSQISEQDSVNVFNMQTGVRSDDGKYELALWCKNCGDERYFSVSFNSPVDFFPGLGAAREGYLERPRTFGVSLTARF